MDFVATLLLCETYQFNVVWLYKYPIPNVKFFATCHTYNNAKGCQVFDFRFSTFPQFFKAYINVAFFYIFFSFKKFLSVATLITNSYETLTKGCIYEYTNMLTTRDFEFVSYLFQYICFELN